MQNPVRYPAHISPSFRSFLSGLLQKVRSNPLGSSSSSKPRYIMRTPLTVLPPCSTLQDARKRLGWPELLNHPFVAETEAERSQRLARERGPKAQPRFRMERFLESAMGQAGASGKLASDAAARAAAAKVCGVLHLTGVPLCLCVGVCHYLPGRGDMTCCSLSQCWLQATAATG